MNEWRQASILGGKFEGVTAIQQEEATELGRLAKGKVVLEIGAAHGYSAIYMSLAGASAVVSVDDHCGTSWLGDTRAIMQRNLLTYNVSNVVIVAQSDRHALPVLCEVAMFDMVFVDGDGEYDSILFDINWAKKLIGHSGVIAIHDYGHPLYPDKRIVCDEVFPEGPTRMVQSLFIKEL